MENICLDTTIHPDDVIYNALLDGGENEIICMKYAILGAIRDSQKPENERSFYKDEPELMNHFLSLVESAHRAKPEKVEQTLNEWFVEVENDLDRKCEERKCSGSYSV